VQRSYLLSVAAGPGPRPLVVVFHGFGQNGRWMDRYTRLPREGVAAGFAVATPDGYAGQWNFPRRHGVGPDDVRFVRDMVRAIGEKLCLDRNDVFVTGFSDGADMADTVACVDPEIRAVAGVAASVPVRGCAHPVDVLQIHGDADPVVPFDGGGGDRPPPFRGEEAVSVGEQMKAWRAVDGCSGHHAARTRPYRDISEIRTLGCHSPRSVLLVVVHGGGHTWPGATITLPYGATNRSLSATTRVLYFFHRLVRA
jgi:polyhydroxybutyrate depolymerase